ncbi:MAG: hypothetical protein ABIK79_03020 [Chloroflexota bacterium]|nr:hypothetical protein [Anaerolineae bacterium]
MQIVSEQDVLREAEDVLVKHLGLAKTARVWAAWRQGAGDYLEIRERLFQGETVETLCEKVQEYESKSSE